MKYYIKKLLDFLTTLLLVTLVTFFTFQCLPGNPALAILGPDADEVQLENLEKELELDKTLPQRYLSWISGAVHGNLGTSYKYRQKVSTLIGNSFKITFCLALLTLLFTVIIGLAVGISLTVWKNKGLKSLQFFNQIWISVPGFCTAILLIFIFSVKLNWFPSMGINGFKSYILPSLSLALGSGAILTRYIKTSIENQLQMDYVKTARSKGLNQKQVIFRHVLKNALIPSVTTLGLITAEIFGGSIIVENVFSIPGIGKLLVSSISSRDFPLLQGLTLYIAAITLFCNFIVDLLYSLIDPRIAAKAEKAAGEDNE